MTLGQRIQELRKQRGMSQERLGDALGVSRQAVSKWEGDNGIPELDTLIAMSRLFGVTVGQLLGVEEPEKQKDTHTGEADADKVEAVLRRYAEQTEVAKQKGSWLSRWGWIVSAAIVMTTVLIVLFVQSSSLRSTVRLLRSDLNYLRADVSNSQNNLPWQIRNTIYEVLAEEAEPLSTFGWKIIDFDLDAQTATLLFEATMKEYSAGSRLQFCADWRKADESEGQTTSEWVDGPDFQSEITLPMNGSTEICIRIEDTAGNIREQVICNPINELHPDNFHLFANNLIAPFAVTVNGFGFTTSTVKTEQDFILISSMFPDFIWPQKAVLTAYLNDTEILSEALTLAASEEEDNVFLASIADNYLDLAMQEGDVLEVVLVVTDNLGRTEQFVNRAEIVHGYLEQQEEAAPVISAGN